MKKRSFIPIASLVVLSGIAAVSGTFAWFQTSRTLSLSFTDAQVRSRDSNLNVEFVGSLNSLDAGSTAVGGVAAPSGNYDIKLITSATSQFVTDISGDGINFYKLDNTASRVVNDNALKLEGVSWYVPTKIDDVTLADANSADGYMLDFTLKLSRTQLSAGYSDDLLVYLGSGTKIEPFTAEGGDPAQRAKDLAAVAAARMSIVNVKEAPAASEVVALYAPVAEEATIDRWIGNKTDGSKDLEPGWNNNPLYTYLAKGTAGTHKAYKVDGYQLLEMPGAKVLTGEFTDQTDPTNKALSDGMILELNNDNAVTLNFRVWIEGTDSDTGYKGNDPIGGKIKLSLDLYTLQESILIS